MKKQLLLILLMLAGTLANAQYMVSGTVKNTSGTPLQNRQVFVRADSTINPKWFPTFNLQDSTDVNGIYTLTMPSTVVSGMQVMVSTVNCNSVLLTKTYVYNGTNLTSNFSICTTPAPTITGQISMGVSATRAPNAKVQLISKQVDTVIGSTTYYSLKAVDSVIASSNGNFALNYPFNSADMILRASFQSFSGQYAKYAPTYYSDFLTWPEATLLPKNTSSTANIVMKPVNNPGGLGNVSGFVVTGAGKSTAVGDPVPNRLILLTDTMDNVTGFTLSANDGTFGFYGVPYGNYKIFGDVLGKTSQPLYFSLDASHKNMSFITFDDKIRTFNPRMPSLSITTAEQPVVSLYPNPAKDRLVLDNISTDAHATIYDMTGRKAMDNILLRTGFINEVNISQLPQGNYVLQVILADGNQSYKFSKE